MKWLKSAIAALLMITVLAGPAFAQVDQEKDTALAPARAEKRLGQLVFTSAIDTIATTNNDYTGTCFVAGHSYLDPVVVYTLASGGTVALDFVQQVAPTPSGPWISAAHDTISSTGSGSLTFTEGSDYRMPYFRLLVDGHGSNDAATRFSALYVVFTKDPINP